MTLPIAKVALDTPLPHLFDYLATAGTTVGSLVNVTFGRRLLTGIVVEMCHTTTQAVEKLKKIERLCSAIPAFETHWLHLCLFASQYYLRGPGEVMLPAIPSSIREPKRWPKLDQQASQNWPKLSLQETSPKLPVNTSSPSVNLLRAQQEALDALCKLPLGEYAPFLLHGITGSGKTEIYLRFIAKRLADDNHSQLLLLVPEINLTPQFEIELRLRFPEHHLAVLHSGLAEGQRATAWLAAHLGRARIILGTRLAILASIPYLAAIIVDEEHDGSYKQQEGLRYSARDLAIWRARQLAIPVVLGSATPSLESWSHSQPPNSRYRRLTLAQRAQPKASLPQVKLIDLNSERKLGRPLQNGLSQPLLQAIRVRLERGEQSLLYLNRRGYAPVLSCGACGWLSGCTRCSTNLVLHRHTSAYNLCCHHCGLEMPAPRHCPSCGNVDLAPLGRGTQRIEETLMEVFPQARTVRIDADSTRHKGSAQALFSEVHAGVIDILVGTQMVAKGHDFQRITLVGILNPDTALYSQNFRSGEQLFAQLMQVAGRAGRAGLSGEVLVQTGYPQAEIYQALLRHDYPGYADSLLSQRKTAGLPPFSFQALLTVEAKNLQACLLFLKSARDRAVDCPDCVNDAVNIFDPVPRTISKIAGREHAQLLIESSSRPALQRVLSFLTNALPTIKPRQKWLIERDPAMV